MAYGEPITPEELPRRTALDLLARMIYGEAEGESREGKCAVACVARNRKNHANASEFGGTTYKAVILAPDQFASVESSRFLAPDVNSAAWSDCMEIAQNMDEVVNPIGGCLWFCTNGYYGEHSRVVNGQEQYTFNATTPNYKDVVEKYVLGGHTFFRLRGY